MKTYTPAPAEQTQQQKPLQATQTSAQLFAQPQETTIEDARPEAAQLCALQTMMAASPQQQKMQALQAQMAAGSLVQRMEDEELLQGKFESTQLMEDEELLQGKFETAQLMAEEEPLQGKFSEAATAQLAEKPNNTGLPNQLKAGIESLSGMSMDHVKVHYNSDKPAQLNAHAYAQGSDIHVAAGQEQHLPHEAWHVVQQAQGRVKPTVQMKGGVSVNDDVGLEREADVMGAQALQAMGDVRDLRTESVSQMGSMQLSRLGGVGMLKLTSQRMQRKSGIQSQLRIGKSPVDASSYTPLQRMVTQIIPGEAEKIKSINVVGRPEKLFSNSMGDHTTAFATHIAGIRLKLGGKTFQNAILELTEIYKQAKSLPGYALKDTLSAEFGFGRTAGQGLRLKNAETELIELINTANANTDITAKALLLQDAISAYLEFRELIPLSGVNVMAVAPALAGKGKGESGHVAAMVAHENGTKQAQETLKNAVLGTFDMYAAVLVATSVDKEQLATLAPGVPVAMPINERILLLVRQHLQSLYNNFPNSVKDAGVDEKSLGVLIFHQSKGQLQLLLKQISERIKLRKEDFNTRNESIQAGISKSKYDKEARDAVALEIINLEGSYSLVSGALSQSTGFEIETKPLMNLDQKADIKDVVNKEQEEDKGVEEEVARSPIATQVRLTGDVQKGYIIKSLELAGRPPSPISGSMGAHTSAWLLHEARIRGALNGKEIGKAVATMGILVEEAIALHTTLDRANPPREYGQDELAKLAKKTLLTRRKHLSDLPKKDRTATRLAFELQQYINELLTYTNYIPGVTRAAANTDGRGEAMWKKTLTSIEYRLTNRDKKNRTSYRLMKFECEQVSDAIKGLLDVKDLQRKDVYLQAHLELLEKVFPKTFNAYKNKDNPFF